MPHDDKEKEEYGALWLKQSAKGNDYFWGKIGGQEVVVFAVRDKKNPKQPDYRVYKSTPRGDSNA